MKLAVAQTTISGEVKVPGSKSHTIRALAIASVADGSSIIRAPLISEDTISSLTAASAMGAWIKRGDDSLWKVTGTGGQIMEPAKMLNLNNSGTGIKFFGALASLSDKKISFDGDESLRSRPMKSLLTALNGLGVKTGSADGKCPFWVNGPISGGETDVEGKSSQYLSALLIALPLASADSIVNVHDLNEIPYVDMTIDWLKKQNVKMQFTSDYSRFQISGKQKYKAFNCKIPGDFSTSAFPAVAAVVTGGKVKLSNLDFNDPQGDKAVFDYLKEMGADVKIGKDSATVSAGKGKLKAVKLDMNATPDLLPVMAVAAACAEGTTVLHNVAQARIKETDRIALMTSELTKMRIKVEQFEDGMSITGGTPVPAHVSSGKDHRIAMSLAIAGMTVPQTPTPTVIDDAECIAVTYPGFFNDFTLLGAKLYLI